MAQTRSRVYNNLNRLTQDIGAAGQTTAYAYDTQGNAPPSTVLSPGRAPPSSTPTTS